MFDVLQFLFTGVAENDPQIGGGFFARRNSQFCESDGTPFEQDLT